MTNHYDIGLLESSQYYTGLLESSRYYTGLLASMYLYDFGFLHRFLEALFGLKNHSKLIRFVFLRIDILKKILRFQTVMLNLYQLETFFLTALRCLRISPKRWICLRRWDLSAGLRGLSVRVDLFDTSNETHLTIG